MLDSLATAIRVCDSLGLPSAPEKLGGPATSLTFLGIEIDTVQQELRLPAKKLRRLQQTLAHWASKINPTKLELQSLIGLLSHAATVVRPGRIFMRNHSEIFIERVVDCIIVVMMMLDILYVLNG